MRKRAFHLLLCGLAASSVQASSLKSAAKDLANGLIAASIKRVAVLPFPYHDGTESSGSTLIAEQLTTYLVQHKGISVVERSQLDRAIREMKFQMSGAFDPATAQKLGQLLGVDALVIGTLVDYENPQTELNARVMRTATGELLAAATTRVERTWDDLPEYPAGHTSDNGANSEGDETSHLHMSALIPTHPAHRRRLPPPEQLMLASAGPNSSGNTSGADVIRLTNDDLKFLPPENTPPDQLVSELLDSPSPESFSMAKRIYHRNPLERTRAHALMVMGELLERQGRPGWAAYTYRQLLREFPTQADFSQQAQSRLAALHP